jgi:hypothetical protein
MPFRRSSLQTDTVSVSDHMPLTSEMHEVTAGFNLKVEVRSETPVTRELVYRLRSTHSPRACSSVAVES